MSNDGQECDTATTKQGGGAHPPLIRALCDNASQTEYPQGDDSSMLSEGPRGRNHTDTLSVSFRGNRAMKHDDEKSASSARSRTLAIVEELPKKRRKLKETRLSFKKIGRKRPRTPKTLLPTARAEVPTPGFTQINMMQAIAEYKILANNNPYDDPNYLIKIQKFEAQHFDWSRMMLYKECMILPRHKRPHVKIMPDSQIMAWIGMLR